MRFLAVALATGVCLTGLAGVGLTGVAQAEGSAVLTRMLMDGRNFRVRARAAVALGHARDGAHAPALEQAMLRDRHPSVRSAAASALGALSTARSLPALRSAARDPVRRVRLRAAEAVRAIEHARAKALREASQGAPTAPPPAAVPRWDEARYAVVVGEVRDVTPVVTPVAGAPLERRLREAVSAQLGRRRDIVVVAAGDGSADEAQRRKLPSFRLEANLTVVRRRVSDGTLQVRCEVSLLVLDEPGRSLRSVLRGAATGVESVGAAGEQGEHALVLRTVDSAVLTALDNASRALDAAAAAGPEMASIL